MKNRQILGILAAGATFGSAMFARNMQATIVGGGSTERGRCTVEVVVDDRAQIELLGATANLRTLAGQPAQWRRFECTGALPANPANFRFTAVGGRGRQDLVRDPRNGGAAVVEIEDKDGGAETYRFDVDWDSRGGPLTRGNPSNDQWREQRGPGEQRANRDRDSYRDRSEDQYRPNYRDSDYYHRYSHGFGVDEAVRICQQAVLTQAARRFHTSDVHFLRTAIDNSPGRDDWVTGTMDVHRGPRGEKFGFSCSVNFDNGRVRSAALDPAPIPYDPGR